MRHYLVRKAGGTTVGTTKALHALGTIIRSEQEQTRSCGLTQIAVVSAPNITKGEETLRTTNTLQAVIEKAASNDPSDEGLYDALRTQIQDYCGELWLPRTFLDKQLDEINALRKAQHGNELSPRDYDACMAYGEKMSAPMAAEFFRRIGIKEVVHASPRDIGMITNGSYRDATLLRESYENIARFFASTKEGAVIVVDGFYGVDRHGDSTTFGRGASDFSATMIGNAVQNPGGGVSCRGIEIWTDTPGVRTANPKKYRVEPRLVDELSYEQALVLSMVGGNIIHHRAITPAARKRIPIFVGDPRAGYGEGTAVVSKADMKHDDEFKMVTSIPVSCRVTLRTPEMVDRTGFMEAYHHVFTSLGIPTIYTVEGFYSATTFFTPDNEDVLSLVKEGLSEIVEKYEPDLPPSNGDEISTVTETEGKAIVTVLGNFQDRYGSAAKVHQIIAEEQVPILTRIPSVGEPHISFAVRQEDEIKAVRALHNKFFGGGK